MERPPHDPDYDGYEWHAEVEGSDWLPANPGQLCTQPKCRRPAVMQLRRTVSRRYSDPRTTPLFRWWGCCDKREHTYGRWFEDGKVWHWVLRQVAAA